MAPCSRCPRVLKINNNLISGTIPTEIQFIGSHVPPDEMAWALEDIPANHSRTEYTYVPPAELTSTKGLQQFERDHREASIRRAEENGGGASSEDDAFRKMAMSFYKEDSSDLRSTRKATELSRLHRRRGTPTRDAMGEAGETW